MSVDTNHRSRMSDPAPTKEEYDLLKKRVQDLETLLELPQTSTTVVRTQSEVDGNSKLAQLMREAQEDSHPESFYRTLVVLFRYQGHHRGVNEAVADHLDAYLHRQPYDYRDLISCLAEAANRLLNAGKPCSGAALLAECKGVMASYLTTVLLNLRVQQVAFEYDRMAGNESRRLDHEAIMRFFIAKNAGQSPQVPTAAAVSREPRASDPCVTCHKVGHGNKTCNKDKEQAAKQSQEPAAAGKKKGSR